MTRGPTAAGARLPVGLVGVGRMGLPMARHILAAGFELAVFDSDAKATSAAASLGATRAASLAELAAASEVVLVLVPTDADVRAVCCGEGGLAANARAGAMIVVCSSVLPETVQAVSKEANQHGVAVLDAPLTRGVRGAEAGDLTVLVGGDAAHLERVRPVLDCFSKVVHHLGPVGAGQVGKTVNNILLWVHMAAACEALDLGARLGVAPERMRSALQDCSADSWVLRTLPQIQPTWPAKDLENALRMAAGAACTMPLTQSVAANADDLSAKAVGRLLAR